VTRAQTETRLVGLSAHGECRVCTVTLCDWRTTAGGSMIASESSAARLLASRLEELSFFHRRVQI
jgi:hypothetical protein